jgi:hypothetical protein
MANPNPRPLNAPLDNTILYRISIENEPSLDFAAELAQLLSYKPPPRFRLRKSWPI